MTRRKLLLIGGSILLLLGVIAGSAGLVAAMSRSNGGDTEMTKSVARVIWQGSINGKARGYLCTGSVVGDDWVLTAYHCLYSNDDPPIKLDPKGFTVQLWQEGVKDIQRPDYFSGLSEPPEPKVMDNAFSGTTQDYRDVALLHLAKPMPNWAKTIPTAPSWPPVGTALTEYGYGQITQNGPIAVTLEKSQQGSIRRANCPSGEPWTTGQICIASSSSLPEHGDSGGPLLWWDNGYWQQVGSLSAITTANTSMRSYWSETDGDTRNWILTTIGANVAYGTILRDQASGASWIYGTNGYEDDLYRHWIPDGATYNCLINNGATVLNRPLRTIEALPDMVGNHATCIPKQPTVTPPTATPPTVTPLTATPTTVTPPTVTPMTVTPPTVTPPTVTPISHPVDAYSNYGQTNLVGHAMCRGNPGNPLSMPGGTGTQTFTVPAGVSTLSSAMVQVDPADVTAHLTVYVNGVAAATASAGAVGDTHFTFGPISVRQGDTVELSITFTATYGKIITLYTVGNPGGIFTAQNSCPDGAPSVTVTNGGLRAVVSGMS